MREEYIAIQKRPQEDGLKKQDRKLYGEMCELSSAEFEASGRGCLPFMCLLFHYRCKGSSDGVLERLFTPLSGPFKGRWVSQQFSVPGVKTQNKREQKKFYFVGEHQGEIFGSHLELRVAWEDQVNFHPLGNFAELQFAKTNCLNKEKEERKSIRRGFIQTSIDAFTRPENYSFHRPVPHWSWKVQYLISKPILLRLSPYMEVHFFSYMSTDFMELK